MVCTSHFGVPPSVGFETCNELGTHEIAACYVLAPRSKMHGRRVRAPYIIAPRRTALQLDAAYTFVACVVGSTQPFESNVMDQR